MIADPFIGRYDEGAELTNRVFFNSVISTLVLTSSELGLTLFSRFLKCIARLYNFRLR